MFLTLGTLPQATYKATTDAIETYQTKIDLAGVNANNANVTIAFTNASNKKKVGDFEFYKQVYYANRGKGKGGGDKNSSRSNSKSRGRGKGSGKGGKGKSEGKKPWGSRGRGSGKDAEKKDNQDLGKAQIKSWSCSEKDIGKVIASGANHMWT